MIGVHLHFGFMPETLFIAVNLLDRYTQLCPIALDNYQLVAVTALYTASRYQEIDNYKRPADFAEMTDNNYTPKQVLDCYFDILTQLEFDLTFPTAFTFLERILQLAGVDKNEDLCHLARFLCEMTLVDSNMLKWLPS